MLQKELLKLLEENRGAFISGQTLAARLGVTRAAVWKGIRALEQQGYRVTAVSRKGYMLHVENDRLSVAGIEKYLKAGAGMYALQVVPQTGSTNTDLKAAAQNGAPANTVLITEQQTAGKGRKGRSFYSPGDTGIYMSLLLRPKIQAQQAIFLTTAAAVAVCRAIECFCDRKPQVKWVNDVLIDDKKVCGILTEAAINLENGELEYAVLGMGINAVRPAGGFPAELEKIAGSVFEKKENDCRNRLTAEVLNQLTPILQDLTDSAVYEDYKSRSVLLGKNVRFVKNGVDCTAKAIGLDSAYRLVVQYPNGDTEALFSGEVSCRLG